MSEDPRNRCYLSIDVAEVEVRAAIVDARGRTVSLAKNPIKVWRPKPGFVEQSSNDIWRGVCAATRQAIVDAAVSNSRIRGIGFSAVPALVVLNSNDRHVSISPAGSDEQNVIAASDRRAARQVDQINKTRHDVLKFIGGMLGPEMQVPRLLWIKQELPDNWKSAARFLDLADFLVYRATACDVRSLSTLVGKWNYLGHEQPRFQNAVGRWHDAFFQAIGLDDLTAADYLRIGQRVRPIGEAVGEGVADEPSRELGVVANTPVAVATSSIHAGGLGVLGTVTDNEKPTPDVLETRIAWVVDARASYLSVASKARLLPGFWGPHYSALVPGLWLMEGGQHAAAALLDHAIAAHPKITDARRDARKAGVKSIPEFLNSRIDALASRVLFPAQLTRDLHVLPYHRGNRTPRANPTLRGMTTGVALNPTIDDLALQYYAFVQALAYDLRHTIEVARQREQNIQAVFVSGPLAENPLATREFADATGCRIVLAREGEPAVVGGAVIAAVAAGDYKTIVGSMAALNAEGKVVRPGEPQVRAYHDLKYQVFLRLCDDQLAYRKLMRPDAG